MTFTDPGNSITSDGSTYRDGIDGVSCGVGGTNSNHTNDNNIKMTLAATKTKARYILGYFTNPVSGYSALTSPVTSTYIIIEQIANMAPGQTTVTNAHYQFNNQSWTVNWCGGIAEGGCATDHDLGSMAVSVSRSADGQHWQVTTSGNLPVGDEADLYDIAIRSQVGLYHMPFQITIDCLTTCQ